MEVIFRLLFRLTLCILENWKAKQRSSNYLTFTGFCVKVTESPTLMRLFCRLSLRKWLNIIHLHTALEDQSPLNSNSSVTATTRQFCWISAQKD